MAPGGCRSCGAMLPLDAAFCPRCGVRVDAVPVIPLVGEGVAEAPVERPPDAPRSGRTLVGVVVAVLALLVGLSVVAGSDDGDAGHDEASAATSTTERTTTTRPRPTSTSMPSTSVPETGPPQVLDSEVRLDPSYGMGLVAVIDESIVLVDLASGKTTELAPPTEVRAIRQLVWTGENLLVAGGQGFWRLVPGPAGPTWQAIDTAGRSVDWIDPSGVVHLGGATFVVSAMVDASGVLVELDSPTLPGRWGGISYATDDGAGIVSTSDGIFLVRPDGSARRITTGRLIGASEGALLRYACDDAMDCGLRLGLVDGATLVSDRSIGVPSTDALEIWAGGVGPDGSTAWVNTFDANGGGMPQLWIWSGTEWVAGGSSDMVGEWVTWSPNGRALLGIGHWPSVEVVDLDAGPSSIRIDHRVRSGDMGWLLALVPLDAVSSDP